MFGHRDDVFETANVIRKTTGDDPSAYVVSSLHKNKCSKLSPAGWARSASVMIWIALEGFGLHSSGALWRAPRVQRGFSGSGPGLWAALGRSGSLSRPSGFGTHHVALSGQRPTCHSVHPGRGDSSVRAQGVAAGGRVARLNNSRFFIKLRRSLQYGVAKHCNPTQATTAGAPPAPTR